MLVRLFILLTILLSGVVASTDATAQNTDTELQLATITSTAPDVQTDGTTEITWTFAFANTASGVTRRLYIENRMDVRMFEFTDSTLSANTTWSDLEHTGFQEAVNSRNFNGTFAVKSTTAAGFGGTATARFRNISSFPSGVDVVSWCDNCNNGGSGEQVITQQFRLEATGNVQSQTIAVSPELVGSRVLPVGVGSSRGIGDTVGWTITFTGGTPNNVDVTDFSNQFEARISGDIIPLKVTGSGLTYTATSDPLPGRPGTASYSIFTTNDYASNEISNDVGNVRFKISNFAPVNELGPNVEISTRLFTNTPPPIPTLSTVSLAGEDSADAGDNIRWNLTFENSAPTNIDVDTATVSSQFEVRYNDGITDHIIDVNVTGSGLAYTVTSAAIPVLNGTNKFSLFTKSTYTPAITDTNGTGAQFSGAALAADTELTTNATTQQVTNIPPPTPSLTVVRKGSTQGVRKPDEVTWTLTFTNSPSGILLDDTQFVARAIDSSGALIPTSTIPAIDVTLTAETAGSIYTATGTIANSNTDTTITYGLFNKIDLHAAITTSGGGLQFGSPSADLDTPLTPLTPAATNRYNNLAPLIPVLTLTRTGADASVGSGVALTWNFAFTNDPGPADGNNTDGITIGVSDQFHVCFGSGQSLALTLAGTASPYTATSAVTSALGGAFNYHVCTIDNADDNANDIGTPSDGVINYTTTESTYTNIGDEITSDAKSYANDPPAAPNITNVSIVAPQRKTAAGDVQWTITFAAGVQGVDKDEFTINNGGTVTDVTPTTGNSFTVTANVTVTPTTDTPIHLTRIANSTIQLSDGSNVGYPLDTPARVLTTTGANNHFILNTDTTRPTIGARTDIIRVDTDGSSANGQRVTAAGNIRWRVTFDSPVYGVGTEDFRVVVEGASAVVPNDVVFTDGNDFAVVVFAAQGTPTTDTNINLDFHTAISIADSTGANGNQNPFQVPGFATNRRLTDATNNYVFNTDTSSPTLDISVSGNQRLRGADTAVWTLTFSEDVSGVEQTDFTVSDASNSISGFSATTANRVFDITVTIGQASTSDVRVNLSIITGHGIARMGGNGTAFAPASLVLTTDANNFIINDDVTGPAITSITTESTPDRIAALGGTITYAVTFDQEVEDIDPTDFVIVATDVTSDTTTTFPDFTIGTPDRQTGNLIYHIEVTVPNNGAFTTVNSDITSFGDNNIRLAVASGADIDDKDGNENPIDPAATISNSEAFQLDPDFIAPTVTGAVRAGTNPTQKILGTTGNRRAEWDITFDKVVTTPSGTDFEIDVTGNTNATLVDNNGVTFLITPTADPRLWSVLATLASGNDYEGDHTLNLRIRSTNGITSANPNRIPFAQATLLLSNIGTDGDTSRTYNTDNSRPHLESITTQSTPDRVAALGDTITYAVEFSEPITGLDKDDFEISLRRSGTANPHPMSTAELLNAFDVADPTDQGSNVYHVVVTVPAASDFADDAAIAAFGDSDIRLTVKSSGTDIIDNNGNANTFDGDVVPNTREVFQFYPDFAEPTVTNVENSGTNPNAKLRSGVAGGADANLSAEWTVTFDQNMRNINPDDFEVNITGTNNAVLNNGSAGTTFTVDQGATAKIWDVKVTLPENGYIGDHTLNLRIRDNNTIERATPNRTILPKVTLELSNIGAGGDTSRQYNTDNSRPTILSIARLAGSDERIAALGGMITYAVTFSEPITGIDKDDFAIVVHDTGTTDVNNNFTATFDIADPDQVGSTNVYNVVVTVPVAGDFTGGVATVGDNDIKLGVVPGSDITDSNNNANPIDGAQPTAFQFFQLNPDFTEPGVTAARTDNDNNPLPERTFGQATTTAIWKVSFDHDVQGITADGSDFAVNNSQSISVTNIELRSALVTATLDTTGVTTDTPIDLAINTNSDIRRTGVNSASTLVQVADGQIQHSNPATEISYILNTDVAPPLLTIPSVQPASQFTNGTADALFNLRFDKPVMGVTTSTTDTPTTLFEIVPADNTFSAVTGVTYNIKQTSGADRYQLTVSNLPTTGFNAGTKFKLRYVGGAGVIKRTEGNQIVYTPAGNSGDIEPTDSTATPPTPTFVTLATGTPGLELIDPITGLAKKAITASPDIEDDGTGTLEFTINFATPVNIRDGNSGNIQLRTSVSPNNNVTNFTLAAASGGAPSPYRGTDTVPSGTTEDRAGTFSDTWTVTTPIFTVANGATATLTVINFTSIDAIGTTALTDPDPNDPDEVASAMLAASFVSVAPTVSSIERVNTTHASLELDRTEGGTDAITWVVQFNQAVSIGSGNDQVVLTPALFDVVQIDSTGPPITFSSPAGFDISSVVDADNPAQNRRFRVTANLPTSNYDADEDIHLAIVSGSNIHGALGARSSSDATQIRTPIASANEGIITDTTDNSERFILNTDTTPPTITSITRSDSRVARVFDNNSNDGLISWDIVFDLPVENVTPDGSDFLIVASSGNNDFSFTDNISVKPTGTTDMNFTVEYTINDTNLTVDYTVQLLLQDGSTRADIRRRDGNHIAFVDADQQLTNDPTPNDGNDTNDNHYIYNFDTDAPMVTDISFTPDDRFSSAANEDITWIITFDEETMGHTATQFEIRDASGTDIGTNLAVDYDSTNNQLSVTGRATFTDPTKISLHYVGTGDDIIRRMEGNLVPFAPITIAGTGGGDDSTGNLTDPARLYALAVGTPEHDDFATAANNETGVVTFTVNFASRVTNVSANNFTAAESDGTNVSLGTPAPVSGGSSVYGGANTIPTGATADPATTSNTDSTAFASSWTIEAASVTPDGNSVTLTFDNISGINPEGPALVLDALPTTTDPNDPSITRNPFVVRRFRATEPTVSSVTRSTTHTNVTGQENIGWEVVFDQSTIRVDASDFEVVDDTGTPITGATIVTPIVRAGTAMGRVDPANSNSDMVPEATRYTISANLPDTGFDTDNTAVHLRIVDTNNILGASGADGSAANAPLTREPFVKADTTITNGSPDTVPFTYRTLDVESVTFELFDAATAGNALTGGTSDSPASRPQRIEWTVTYNINPATGIAPPSQAMLDAYYDISCTVVDCTSVDHSGVVASSNTHVISATLLPNPSNASAITATLGLGSTPLNDTNTDINLTGSNSSVVSYHRSLVNQFGSAKTSTQVFYLITFNAPIEGLIASEVTFQSGGTDLAGATVDLTGTGNTRIATVTLPNNGSPSPTGNLSLKITDTDDNDRIRVVGNNNRIAYAASGGGVYDASSTAVPFAMIPDGASIPSLTVTRATDSTGTTPLTAAAIDGDAGDNDTADTYYWTLQFDQNISERSRGISSIDLGVTDQFALQFIQGSGSSVDTIDGIDNTDVTITQPDPMNASLYVASFTPGVAGIDESTTVHLAATANSIGAGGIMGEERIDTSNPSETLIMGYVRPSDNDGRLTDITTAGAESFTLLNRARWTGLSSVTDGNAGNIIFRATFSRPISGLAESNFAPLTSTPSGTLTHVFGTIAQDTNNTSQWNIPVTVGNFDSTYTGFVTLATMNITNLVSTDNSVAISQHIPTSIDHRYEATIPIVMNVDRVGNMRTGMNPANPHNVSWTVTFDQGTINVDSTDFRVVGVSGATIDSTTGVVAISPSTVDYTQGSTRAQVEQATSYTVTATLPTTGSPNDTNINLSIASSNDIEGSAGSDPNDSMVQIRQRYDRAGGEITSVAENNHFVLNTDNAMPSVLTRSTTRVLCDGQMEISQYTRGGTGAGLVCWSIRFSEPVKNVAPAHFAITGPTGNSTITITPSSPSSATADYVITAQLPSSGNDTSTDVHLALSATATGILDRNDNPVDVPTDPQISGTNSLYILDTDPPTLRSFALTAPAAGSRDIVWTATFNEAVRGVTSSSFTLSQNSSIIDGPTANADSTIWTFTTRNSGRYGGSTSVTERSNSGVTNTSDFPVIPNSPTLATMSHTFTAATITALVPTFGPAFTRTRDGFTEANRVGNLETVSWQITYSEATPLPSNNTYEVVCSCSQSISAVVTTDATGTATTSAVHTITVSDLPIIDNGSLTLGNGSDAFTDIDGNTTGNREVHIDTLSPSLSELVVDSDNNRWEFTFSEDVVGFSAENFEFTPSITGSATIAGSGTDYTVTILSQSEEVTLSFRESTVDATTGVVTGGMDAAGNPLSGRRINGVLLPSDEIVMEHTQELIMDFVEYQAAQIITNTPSLTIRTARSTIPRGGIDIGTQNFTAEVTDDQSQISYTGNFVSALWPSNNSGSTSLGHGPELWTNITYAVSDFDTGAKSSSFFSTTGVDFAVKSSLVWGLLLQIDLTEQTDERTFPSITMTHTSSIDSFGWLGGYYGVYEFGDFAFEGRAALGGSDVEISPLGNAYTNEYSTERLLVSAGLTRNGYSRDHGREWSFIPRVDYTYYSEISESYTDSSAGPTGTGQVIPGMDYKLNRLEFNQTLTKAFAYGDDILVPSVGVAGIYDTSTGTTDTGFSENLKARLDAGFVFTGDSGIDWNAAVYYEGIGSDATTYGLSLGIGINY